MVSFIPRMMSSIRNGHLALESFPIYILHLPFRVLKLERVPQYLACLGLMFSAMIVLLGSVHISLSATSIFKLRVCAQFTDVREACK